MRGRAALVIGVLAGMGSSAAGDDGGESELFERLWPRVQVGPQLTLSQQIADQLAELGNTVGYHVDLLSYDMVALRFDGRRRRAYVRVGGGDEGYLSFRIASDVHFTEGLARVSSRIDLGIAGRTVRLELPELEMAPADYRGDRGVEVRLPLIRRRF